MQHYSAPAYQISYSCIPTYPSIHPSIHTWELWRLRLRLRLSRICTSGNVGNPGLQMHNIIQYPLLSELTQIPNQNQILFYLCHYDSMTWSIRVRFASSLVRLGIWVYFSKWGPRYGCHADITGSPGTLVRTRTGIPVDREVRESKVNKEKQREAKKTLGYHGVSRVRIMRIVQGCELRAGKGGKGLI